MNVIEGATADAGNGLVESETSSVSTGSRLAGPRPQRILYIEANEDGTVGGSHRVLFDLVCNLDRTQYEPIVLFYQDNAYASRLRAHGVDVMLLEEERARERMIRRSGSRAAKLREYVATIARRFRFLRQHRIDLIHINNSPLMGNDDWLPAARILGIPCVANVAGDARGPGKGWLHKRLFRAFDHYLSVSEFITQAMLRAGIKSDRMDLIYPGVDLESFRARVKRSREEVRRELGIPGAATMALMVGNVRQWKGQHVVLAALEQMPASARNGFYVAFAGALTVNDRSYMDELEATVQRAGLGDHVAFLGSRDDVPDLLNAADIGLHASVRPEPFGLVVVEAMSLGKAVVAANSGGPSEVIDRSSGITFDPTAPAQLAEVLTNLVRDHIRRGELGKGALQRAEQFTARRYAAGVRRVYERVLPATRERTPRAHRWYAVALLGAFSVSGCAEGDSLPEKAASASRAEQPPPDASVPLTTSGAAATVDTVASKLEVPWSLDFAPDGRVFVTERVGRVRVIENGALRDEPWAALPVFGHDEQIAPESGLMGIALAPNFASTGHVFVVGTFWKRSQAPFSRLIDRVFRRVAGVFSPRAAIPYENRVYRLTDRGGKGVDATVVIDDLPANFYHAGGGLVFGPDGHLYVTVGEALASAFSNDPETASGRILRYRADGSVPDDNPIPGSPVYAIGLRNPQALAWHPGRNLLVTTEHGPSALPHEGGRSAKDELNLITPGANYGWPVVAGRASDARFVDPVVEWSPAIAPGGVAFYTGPHAPWQGNAFVGGLRGQQLRRVVFDSAAAAAGQLKVIQEEVLLSQTVGRIRAVRMGPDGQLWITTSNRDRRGPFSDQDDMVLRVRPPSGADVKVISFSNK